MNFEGHLLINQCGCKLDIFCVYKFGPLDGRASNIQNYDFSSTTPLV